jgi:acyl carrier protein
MYNRRTMSKKLIKFVKGDIKNINPDWLNIITKHIELFVQFYDDCTLTDELDKTSEVLMVGYPTQYVRDEAIRLKKEGYDVKLIENLCCDIDAKTHLLVFDNLSEHGIFYWRTFEFLKEDIMKTVKETLESVTRCPFVGRDEDYFNSLGYDSLDIMELIHVIEDKYNTYITPTRLTKFFKVRDFVQVLEDGKISNKFNKKKK